MPKKGDIVFIQFNPQAGREQAGRRPALIVSSSKYNSKIGMAMFCPITSRSKGYPFEVSLPENMKISGAILSDHLKSFDWRKRKVSFMEKVPKSTLDEVLEKLVRLIGLDE